MSVLLKRLIITTVWGYYGRVWIFLIWRTRQISENRSLSHLSSLVWMNGGLHSILRHYFYIIRTTVIASILSIGQLSISSISWNSLKWQKYTCCDRQYFAVLQGWQQWQFCPWAIHSLQMLVVLCAPVEDSLSLKALQTWLVVLLPSACWRLCYA